MSMPASTSATSTMPHMRSLGVRAAAVTYPTGSKDFSVMQPFPAAFTAEETDPFLMCDEFGPTPSTGRERNPDRFPVGWHPHRGFDICTYLTSGWGRHADSLGNRGMFEGPGMQWMSVGSGVEHAEGGGTPAGGVQHGFQLWVNVPSERKMDPPRYGTVPTAALPDMLVASGVKVRVLAGSVTGRRLPTSGSADNDGGAGDDGDVEERKESTADADVNDDDNNADVTTVAGPFETVQPVTMLDVRLTAGGDVYTHTLDDVMDNCLLYVYRGSVSIGDGDVDDVVVRAQHIVRLDASTSTRRRLRVTARPASMTASGGDDDDTAGHVEPSTAAFMLFAGKQLHQPIAWHGPFVMTEQHEIDSVIHDARRGRFPPVRVDYDYRRLDAFPRDHPYIVAQEAAATTASKTDAKKKDGL